MPEISRFYGIVIQIYYADHPPPHFHALYAACKATIDIDTLALIDGELMKRIIGLVFVFGIPVALFADNTNDVNKELMALEGKWKAVAMEAGGKPFPKESVPDFTFIVAANGKSTGQSPQGEYQATITVDPKKSPKTIDNLHETGAEKGKKQYGIYNLEGGKWSVCMTLPGVAEGVRPKDFNTKDTANVVFVFERLKDDIKP